jgi:hypothetical protein
MDNDKKLFEDHKELVERIRREESLQPSERDTEAFYNTKNIFLEHGLSAGIDITLKHKLWRDRGMHGYMRSVLLEMLNHLNPSRHCSHLDRTIESGAHMPGTKYPDITWEHLECHAAVKKVDELRREAEKRLVEAGQNQGIPTNQEQVTYEYLTLEELVDLRHSRDPGSNRVTTEETLLTHCNIIRRENGAGKIEKPIRLYRNKSNLDDIEITEIPKKGTGYKFRRLKDKT